jgi:hypothetical protein
MFTPADYKLSDLLGIAAATIGIIIAAGILLQFFSTRYIAIFERFRVLTGEYRANDMSDSRRSNLQSQIAYYSRQIFFLNWASICVAAGVILFLLTVATASLSVVYPKALVLRSIGTVGLMTGLFLIGVGMCLNFAEMLFQGKVVNKETADFADLPPTEEALRK